MIINSNNPTQRNILTNKCYYLTLARIMNDFEKKGYQNPSDETAKVVTAYITSSDKKDRNRCGKDYAEAFAIIDEAVKKMANQVFYTLDEKSYEAALTAFCNFDYINAILKYLELKKNNV